MSWSVVIKSGILVTLISIFVSLYLKNYSNKSSIQNSMHDNRQLNVLNGLLELEAHNVIGIGVDQPRVAIGYGACNDIFVEALDLFKDNMLSGAPKHYNEIKNDNQLLRNFAYYFKYGAAAERFISDSILFKKWVRKASLLPNVRWALGGNAPVMASRFQLEGCKVLLAAKMTDTLRRSLHKNIDIANGIEIYEDDVHLIMEYDINETWNKIKTPRANRYIVHNDANNPRVSTLEQFGQLLPKFKPDLLVISGLQMMDNYPFENGVREQRIEAIKNQMISQGKLSRVHFEMASFVEETLLKELMTSIIPYCDSIGMNEQELTNLHNVYLYGDVTHVVDSNPRIATVLDEMRKLYKLIRTYGKTAVNSKKLSRIHVHTLAYQAILTEKESSWRRPKAAAAKAALTANRHVCGNMKIDIDKARLILDNSFSVSTSPGSHRINVSDDKPVSCWNEQISFPNGEYSNVHICVAPVLVCTEVKQTAGCGDNISSAGLVLQI